jgi:hypothetical protein
VSPPPPPGTVCVGFRYPDGSRQYEYVERLPIGGEKTSRLGIEYIVVSIETDAVGNSIVTLGIDEPPPVA